MVVSQYGRSPPDIGDVRQAMQDVPYIPLGQYFLPMAHRRTLAGASQPGGIPLFWGVTVG